MYLLAVAHRNVDDFSGQCSRVSTRSSETSTLPSNSPILVEISPTCSPTCRTSRSTRSGTFIPRSRTCRRISRRGCFVSARVSLFRGRRAILIRGCVTFVLQTRLRSRKADFSFWFLLQHTLYHIFVRRRQQQQQMVARPAQRQALYVYSDGMTLIEFMK